jgi:putative CocE/NonD family hydrolase
MARRLEGAALALVLVGTLAAGCLTPALTSDLASTTAPGVDGFSSVHVFPGDYAVKGDFARVLVEGALDALPQEVVKLSSEFDGAGIEVGVVRPDTDAPVPVVAFASPYLLSLDTIDFSERLARLVENFVPHGYAVALVPVRGTANMGSCMDLMGPAERADLDQAITWLGEQPWSNGAVGMIGVSYDGSTPWEVASMGNPYLKTIVPISGVNDIYHLMFRNGTNELRGPVVLNALYYQYGFVENNPTNGRSAENTVTGVVCPESLTGLWASVHAAATGERDPLGFWAARDSRPGVEALYKGSIFHVQGLQDWNVDPMHNIPWVLDLEAQGLRVKHLYGQWAHAWPDSNPEKSPHARWDWAETLLRWFDRELKGLDVDVGPRVQVEDSSGRWRSEDAWPPADAWPVTFRLGGDGALATGDGEASAGSFVVTPECGAAQVAVTLPLLPQQTCAVFESAPFDAAFRFAGMPTLPLTVVPQGPGGHVAVTLYAVDGAERTRLGWGQIDLRFADGGERMSVPTPGAPLVARLQLEPLDVVVPAGASLQLVLHQGTYGDHLPSVPTYPVEILVGADAESALTVLAFDRAEDAFFVPPGKDAPESP